MVRLRGLDPKEFGDSVGLGIWLLVSIVSLLTRYSARRHRRKQDGAEAYKDLDPSCLALYQSALDYPTVIDPEKTCHVESRPRDERPRYEAYAYRVWLVCATVYDALGPAKEPTRRDRLRVWPRTALSWLFGTPSVRRRAGASGADQAGSPPRGPVR